MQYQKHASSEVNKFRVSDMSRTYDNERKPSQSTTTVKPTASFLQTRGFAPLQTDLDEDAPHRTGYTENFLEKLINQPSTESAGTPVQRKPHSRLKAIASQHMAIQAKLNIGEPNDKYEKEADATASKVVQQINSPTQDQSVQKQDSIEEDEELQMKPISSIQRDASMEEEEELQMKPLVQRRGDLGGEEASTNLESSIQSARGGGQSLDPSLQTKMGEAMGADFSSVKVHTDSQSDQLNKSIQAKAFTTGQDVFFRQGAYEPSSRGGQELIAHELTHVVQQNGVGVQRLVQREEYLDQRDVSSHYTGANDETTVQRPGLLGAIGSVVTQLQDAHNDYIELQKKMGRGQATLQQVNEKFKLRAKLYEFLRLQDVNVDIQGNLAPDALKDRLVEYDTTPEAQQKTLVNISGTLTRSDSKNTPVDTGESVTFQTGKGWEIFVMSPSGELHMASHKIGKYHHSSLLAGGPTSAAGSIKASGGKIQELNNKSGHYQPGPQQMRQALHRFHSAGVSLDFNLAILGAGAFNGKASTFMDQGGLNDFEFGAAQRILHHFINTKGVAAVSTAFTNIGWDYKLQMGRILISKPSGDAATHKEVSSVITTHFNSAGPVSRTRD